ncbi:MAG: SUMF1/EgtB/PvdO family nonheme iron enzyme [Verrucomicrobiota bacterium]
MKRVCVLMLVLSFGLVGVARGVNVTFGSGVNEFVMAFVEVGDAGNGDDDMYESPFGGTGYEYGIGKYEVSEDAVTKANGEGGLGITQSSRGANRPATGISWNEAARFVNWLNTSEGYQAAYRFEFQPGDVGYSANQNILLWDSIDAWQLDGENLYRHKSARYFLPSEDEWFKAAFYDGDLGVYYNYATASDVTPTAVESGTLDGTAVFGRQSSPAEVFSAGGLSAYGTMGQSGNVFEWIESADEAPNDLAAESRVLRGGIWNEPSPFLQSTSRIDAQTTYEDFGVGFRVAIVPEPSAMLMVFIGGIGMLCRRRRG